MEDYETEDRMCYECRYFDDGICILIGYETINIESACSSFMEE